MVYPLQQIAGYRGHVPQLGRRALDEAFCDQRLQTFDTLIGGDFRHACE